MNMKDNYVPQTPIVELPYLWNNWWLNYVSNLIFDPFSSQAIKLRSYLGLI